MHFYKLSKRIFLLLTVVSVWLPTFAQKDSLLNELDKNLPDTTRLDVLLQIGWLTLGESPEEALKYAQEAEPLAKKVQDPYRAEDVYRLYAFCYGDMNDRPACLDNHMKRIAILEAHGEKNHALASAYYEAASVMDSQGQDENAELFYSKCSQLGLELNHKILYAYPLLPISTIKLERGDTLGAKNDLKLSLSLIGDQDIIIVPVLLSNLSGIYADQDSLELAKKYIDSAFVFIDDDTEADVLGFVYSGAGKVNYKLGNLKAAMSNYNVALKVWEEHNKFFYLQGMYLEMARLYSSVKNDSAGYFYEKHIELSNKVNNEDNNSQIAEMEARYKNQEKQKEIELLSADKKISDIEKKRQSQITLLISILLIAVVVFSVFLFTRFRIIRTQNKLIQEQKKEVETQKEIVEEKSKEILDSIAYAKRLQQAILAPESEITQVYSEHFLLYKPKDIVAGDFYFFEKTSTHVFYAAADCTGHGVPGAMVSIVCSNALSRSIYEFKLSDPGKILDKTRELVVETFEKSGQDVKDGMDISLLVKEIQTGKVTWAGANNPIWVAKSASKSDETISGLIEIKGDKQPIGKTYQPKPFTTHNLEIEKGAAIYLPTDGYADQFGGPKGKKFKYSSLQKLFSELAYQPMSQQKEILEQTFETWRGDLEQLDDVCIVGVRKNW